MNHCSLIIYLSLILWGCQPNKDYKLVWSDEFSYVGLPDSSKWSYDDNEWSWKNNEQQHYTNHRAANAFVDEGYLYLSALREKDLSKRFTSVRLTSKGKGDWLYGKIEVCAKLASGKGIWPTIGLLPTREAYGEWPQSGEIDIVEHGGHASDSVYCSIHTDISNQIHSSQYSKAFYAEGVEDTFNVYAVEWIKDKITFYFNGRKVHSYNKTSNTSVVQWPFDQTFYLILYLAVGGKYGVDESIFPCTMVVDYVRVYQIK